MALDWIPIYPDRVPHRRSRQVTSLVAPSAAVTIAVPVIPGLLAFAPTYPGQVPHRKGTAARTELFAPPVFEAAIAPTSWLPIAPARAPKHHAAQLPTLFIPPPGELIAIAQRMAWVARYPSQVPHRRSPNPGGGIYTVPPDVAAAGVGCVDLVDQDLTSPTLLVEGVTTPILQAESLSAPTLIEEQICGQRWLGYVVIPPTSATTAALDVDAFQDDTFQDDTFQ